ncbi:hypothetical protein [Pedobacter nutrimenti]|uniref:Uncharacterized protein n=1 Tax=Pedobacter nutrimenti TaxID=1241337 RepID=A0A318UL64_9SPHI|nr:hypothetical protein [Pedobacter nutrimenti]PYF77122.1 hypothetical protein B0O44_101601 [Pedobacter nutrimenti]
MEKIKEYIESGILETYVLGISTEEEAREILFLKKQHPEIKEALYLLENDLERIAQKMAIEPPATLWPGIEAEINELARRPKIEALKISRQEEKKDKAPELIDIESKSTHIRIHKIWRWIFAAVFVLGKIFLGFAIYYYLEKRQQDRQINELQIELRQLKTAGK